MAGVGDLPAEVPSLSTKRAKAIDVGDRVVDVDDALDRPEALELGLGLLGDRGLGAEDEDLRLLVARERGLRGGGDGVAVDEEDGVARLGRPARGGDRVLGVLGADDDDVVARAALGLAEDGVDLRGDLRGVVSGDVDGLAARRLGDVADADDLGVAGLLRAGRVERLERALARVGQLLALGEQDRRADRVGEQGGGGDATAPVVLVDQDDGLRGAAPRRRRGRRRGRRRRRWRSGRPRPRAWCSWWRRSGSRGRSRPPSGPRSRRPAGALPRSSSSFRRRRSRRRTRRSAGRRERPGGGGGPRAAGYRPAMDVPPVLSEHAPLVRYDSAERDRATSVAALTARWRAAR